MFVVVLVVITLAAADLDIEWAEFKAKYNKTYDPEMDAYRKSIWIDNKKIIEDHNKLYDQGLSTYYLGENKLADMSGSEVISGYNVIVSEEELKKTPTIDNPSFYDSIDWRQRGYVTEVKEQGLCGACWAFSATGSMEGQHFKKTGKLVSLSESNLIDCSSDFGNEGCTHGLMSNAFDYVIENGGIDTEESYPYEEKVGKCNFRRKDIGATISNFKFLHKGSEAALYKAVSVIGPISAGIYANMTTLPLYKGGLYDDPNCRSTHLNHAVLVVGYGTYKSKPYWLVKNSWGEWWGMHGYIMMSRNKKNQCGIATQASYPIV